MKFTKHFYIEGQRIVSKLGDMGKNQELLNPKDTIRAGNNGNHPIDWDNKHESLKNNLISNFEELGLTGAVFTAGKSGKVPYGQIKKYYRNSNGIIDGYGSDSTSTRNYDGNKAELLQFYYHPDHLGSSNFITNVSGEVYQHMEYFPFGETFIEERTDAEYTTYLYNGKEFDEEIGLYYYGARYYDPRISIWYGADPLMDKHPDYTPYAYCLNNPLIYIDPDGRDGELVVDKKNKTITVHARYYVQTKGYNNRRGKEVKSSRYTSKQITKMNESINKTLNKEGGYEISEGEYKGYSINYNVEFVDGGNSREVVEKANNDPIGNSFQKTGDVSTFPVTETDNGDGTVNTTTAGGKTYSKKYIKMNSNKDTKTNKTHEIIHTFGVDDAHKGGPQGGKMEYPPQRINQEDVNSIVNNGLLNKKE